MEGLHARPEGIHPLGRGSLESMVGRSVPTNSSGDSSDRAIACWRWVTTSAERNRTSRRRRRRGSGSLGCPWRPDRARARMPPNDRPATWRDSRPRRVMAGQGVGVAGDAERLWGVGGGPRGVPGETVSSSLSASSWERQVVGRRRRSRGGGRAGTVAGAFVGDAEAVDLDGLHLRCCRGWWCGGPGRRPLRPGGPPPAWPGCWTRSS